MISFGTPKLPCNWLSDGVKSRTQKDFEGANGFFALMDEVCIYAVHFKSFGDPLVRDRVECIFHVYPGTR